MFTALAILLFGLVYEAIPLSKVAVLASALSFFVQHMILPIPKESRHHHRFAYDIVMVMEPATLLGTTYGVIASKIVPYWIITVLVVFLLLYTARTTLKKARDFKRREHSARIFKDVNEKNNYGTLVERNIPASVRDFYDEESDIPHGSTDAVVVRSILSLLFSIVLIVLNSFVIEKGGFGFLHFQVQCGSWIFYGSVVFISVIVIALTIYNLNFLVKYQEEGAVDAVKLRSLTVHWELYSGAKLAVLCFIAGFLSSFCGVGGSTIKNPILLHLHLNPTLAKNTSQFMLLSTVGSSVFQFWFQGTIPVNYATLFFILSALSAVIGKTAIDYYIRRSGRQSVIIYLLAFYIILAALAMGTIGFIIILGQLREWPNMDWRQLWFRSPCTSIPPDFTALKFVVGK